MKAVKAYRKSVTELHVKSWWQEQCRGLVFEKPVGKRNPPKYCRYQSKPAPSLDVFFLQLENWGHLLNSSMVQQCLHQLHSSFFNVGLSIGKAQTQPSDSVQSYYSQINEQHLRMIKPKWSNSCRSFSITVGFSDGKIQKKVC